MMKFLVVMRPNGSDHSAGNAKAANAQLKKAIKDGHVQAAYAFIGGGCAYVVNADTAADLAAKVRYNPLFSSSHTEIHPIADATDFLDAVARQGAKKK